MKTLAFSFLLTFLISAGCEKRSECDEISENRILPPAENVRLKSFIGKSVENLLNEYRLKLADVELVSEPPGILQRIEFSIDSVNVRKTIKAFLSGERLYSRNQKWDEGEVNTQLIKAIRVETIEMIK